MNGKLFCLGVLRCAPQMCDARRMNDQQDGDVPEWDLADRMRKSLRHAGMSPGQMAVYLGVGGNTVSTWINGRIEPSFQTLRLWSLRTGVDLEWLLDRVPAVASRGFRTAPISTPVPPGAPATRVKAVLAV